MRVAAVQFRPLLADPSGNLARMNELVDEVSKQGAVDLVVFPEMATAGYSHMSKDAARPFAEEAGEGPSFDWARMAAVKLDAAIVWGFIEQEQGRLYNAQALLTPSGHFVTYRKRNRWGQDFLWATPGDVSPQIVKWRGKRVGLIICRDIRDKNDVTDDLYEPGDADIVAASMNFGDGSFPANAWMNFAVNNRVDLVVSNRHGREANNDFGEGGTCIVLSGGEVLCEGLKWSQDCIVLAKI